MSIVNRIFKAVTNELSKPTSFVKGEAFENYVREYVFPKEYYKLLHRTHNFESNHDDYIESSLLPDFEFQCIQTGEKFYVEAKFREGVYNNQDKIEWCKPYQLNRYQKINQQQKVFIILGLGDKPRKPFELIIFPLSAGNFCGLYDSFLTKYNFPYLEKPIFPTYLWRLK